MKAVLIEKDEQGYRAALQELEPSFLQGGDVVVDVAYSTLNYKDALAITGKGPVVRQFPLIPGIDLVGTVVESDSEKFKAGDKVLLNGFGVGEQYHGGLAQRACVKSDWLIHLPPQITPFQAMAIGTAGYTAMLCIITLEKQGITPDSGKILVTGANGGVGSFAISLLAKLGYHVVASTGRVSEAEYLIKLGAKDVIDRNTLSEPGRPLGKSLWAGAIDSVGSHTLANVCAQMEYGGSVAACGLAQGMDFPATVAPFILRGVNLLGIDSVMRPIPDREAAWQKLAKLIDDTMLNDIATTISLSQVVEVSNDLLAGRVQGRVVVDLAL